MTDTPTETPEAADKAIVKPADTPLATVPVHPLMATIDAAVREGRTEGLKDVLDLYERMEAKAAKAAFTVAFAAFQAECPPILKGHEASIKSHSGTSFSYLYPSLEDCEAIALPFLNKHGFTRRYGSVRTEGTKLTASCILEHVAGHSDEQFYELSIESKGGMSEAQKGGAAETYAKRRAFINVAGLKVADKDTDGADPTEPAKTIVEEQDRTIQDLIIQSEADRVLFLKFFGVKQVSDIPSERFEEACRMLNQKIQTKRRGGT